MAVCSGRGGSDGTGSELLVEIILEMQATAPDLDSWLRDPVIRVHHHRQSSADAEHLWKAAGEVRLGETSLLGRLIRWRIPGVSADWSFEQLFSSSPFTVLAQGERSLVSGLVGKIWTLRRDYPTVDVEEFREWSSSGTAKVVFAHWVEAADEGKATLHSETRVKAFGTQGALGLASVRPLIRGFEYLVGSDALAAAVRRAEQS
jgi:hypothetical protein